MSYNRYTPTSNNNNMYCRNSSREMNTSYHTSMPFSFNHTGVRSDHLLSSVSYNVPIDDVNEVELANQLYINQDVNEFARYCVFKTVATAIKIGMKDADIIKYLSVAIGTYKDEKYVARSGLHQVKAEALFAAIKRSDLERVSPEANEILSGMGLNQLMGSIYDFSRGGEFLIRYFDYDESLQRDLIHFVSNIFNVELTYQEIKELLPQMKGNEFLLLDFVVYGISPNLDSLYRKNLANNLYIREKDFAYRTALISPDNLKQGDYTRDSGLDRIMMGNAFYKINENSVFALFMKKFGRKYQAGPSGSCILMHVLLFDLLKIEKSISNRMLLLGCCIGHYVPYFHSLTEILLSYSNEIFPDFKKYKINDDPLVYTLNVLTRAGLRGLPSTVPLRPLPAFLHDDWNGMLPP